MFRFRDWKWIRLFIFSFLLLVNSRAFSSDDIVDAIKRISSENDRQIQEFDDYDKLTSEQKSLLYQNLHKMRDFFNDFGITPITSIYKSSYITPIAPRKYGKPYLVELSSRIEIDKISLESLGGDVKVYEVQLIMASGEKVVLKELSSDTLIKQGLAKTQSFILNDFVQQIRVRSEAFNKNTNLKINIYAKNKVEFIVKKIRRYYCDRKKLYKHIDLLKYYPTYLACAKSAYSLNTGTKFRCEGNELFEGLEYKRIYPNENECLLNARYYELISLRHI